MNRTALNPSVPNRVRCPHCGLEQYALHPAWRPDGTIYILCAQCARPVPSVGWRRIPPLFSWEVHPGLWPSPHLPRRPSRSQRQALALVLLAGAVLLLGLGGGLGWIGGITLSPSRQTVAGTVLEFNYSEGTWTPVTGATVTLSGGPGPTSRGITGATGRFLFRDVPPGVHDVTASSPGYQTETLVIFVAPFESEPRGNLTNLVLELLGPSTASTRLVSYSVFPDLETYLSYLWAASLIEILGGVIALGGAWWLWRGRSPVSALVGAGAGVLSPLLASQGGFNALFVGTLQLALVILGLAGTLSAITFSGILWLYRPLSTEEGPPLP
jgi:hypothetical protein